MTQDSDPIGTAFGTRNCCPTCGRKWDEAEQRAAVEEQMRELVEKVVDQLPRRYRELMLRRAEPLVTGDDIAAWTKPDGEEVPWPERPRLLRLALQDAAERKRKVRNSLRYTIIPQQYDPFPQYQQPQRVQVHQVYSGGVRYPTAQEIEAEKEARAAAEHERTAEWRAIVEKRAEAELSEDQRKEIRRRAEAQLAKSRTSLERLGLWEKTLDWRAWQLIGEALEFPLYPPRIVPQTQQKNAGGS